MMTTRHIRERFNEAVRLCDDDNPRALLEAIELLKPLLFEQTNSEAHLAAVHGQLGFAYLLLKRYAKSEGHYQKCVELSPRSELASLGLYRALQGQGKMDAALAEMRRFTADQRSEEYERILHDLDE